jgi:putative cell wall-binding protein
VGSFELTKQIAGQIDNQIVAITERQWPDSSGFKSIIPLNPAHILIIGNC